jgi:predicted RNA methylase
MVRDVARPKLDGLERVYRLYCEGGHSRVLNCKPATALEEFYLAIVAFAERDLSTSLRRAQGAARRAPESLLFEQSETYLRALLAGGRSDVYGAQDPFVAFIRSGGNVALYEATVAALRASYDVLPPRTVLDIGVGNGMALLPALTHGVKEVTLIDPATAMLELAVHSLSSSGIVVKAWNGTMQDVVRKLDGTWDVAQATFSLQSIPPTDRGAMLAWMRAHAQRVLLAEFDVPPFGSQLSPDRVAYVAQTYERGLSEYVDELVSVGQGFLMPVMFGYFDRTAARVNYEQPAALWVRDLQDAGFTHVDHRLLCTYWWAPAYFLSAR